MTTLPHPGLYRIVQYGVHGQPQILTVDKDRNVTVSAAGSVPEREQEVHLAFWQSMWSLYLPCIASHAEGGLEWGSAIGR